MLRNQREILDPRTQRQRTRILAAIAQKPSTSKELSNSIFLCRDGVNIHVRQMMEVSPRLIHISGWQRNERGRPSPIYSTGDLPDAVLVKSRTPKRHLIAGNQKQNILNLTRRSPMSAIEIGDAIGLSKAQAIKYINELRSNGKMCVKEWRPGTHGGYPTPLYGAGNSKDKPRPPAKTQAEKRKQFWKNLKADPVRHQLYLMMRRLKKQPASWFGVLVYRPRADPVNKGKGD